MVAQPPFSMSERRSQDEETLLNATSFATASVCCWNLSTQIGASAATTAAAARWVAIFSAVLPSVHPSCENPTTANANSAGHCTPYRWFHPGMDLHFVTLAVGEGNFSGFRSTREHSPWPDDEDSLGNYSEGRPTPLDCRISAPPKRQIQTFFCVSLAGLTLQVSSLNVSTARCLQHSGTASPANRLCTSHPTSVTGSARLGNYSAGRSSTATQGALTVPSCQLHDLAAPLVAMSPHSPDKVVILSAPAAILV